MPEAKIDDVLEQEKLRDAARSKIEKEKKILHDKQYKKPKKVETFTKELHTPSGVKFKTIEKRTYENGVVKNRLKNVEKDLGGGKVKKLF